MLNRAYTFKTGQAYASSKIAPLNDIANLSNESKKAITFLYDFDIAQGSNGAFQPSNSLTRAHAAKMFNNFLKVVDE